MHHRWPTKPCLGGGVEPPERCVRPQCPTYPARSARGPAPSPDSAGPLRFVSSAKLKIACPAVLQAATQPALSSSSSGRHAACIVAAEPIVQLLLRPPRGLHRRRRSRLSSSSSGHHAACIVAGRN